MLKSVSPSSKSSCKSNPKSVTPQLDSQVVIHNHCYLSCAVFMAFITDSTCCLPSDYWCQPLFHWKPALIAATWLLATSMCIVTCVQAAWFALEKKGVARDSKKLCCWFCNLFGPSGFFLTFKVWQSPASPDCKSLLTSFIAQVYLLPYLLV